MYQTIPTNPTPGLAIKHRELPFESRYGGEREVARTHLIFFDNTVIATQAGELFVQLGLDFKRRATYVHSMVFGLVDGNIGYVPQEEAYRYGGYGVNFYRGNGGKRTMVPRGFGERLLAAWLEMMYEEDPGAP